MKNEIIYSNGDYFVEIRRGRLGLYYARVLTSARNPLQDIDLLFSCCFRFELDGAKTLWYNPLTWFKENDLCTAIEKAIECADKQKEEDELRQEMNEKVREFAKNWEENCG